MRRITAPLFVIAIVAVSACGSDGSPSDTTSVELANPASVFCVDQGGTVEIVDESDGQVGYCILPDGTRVEEWEYFRSENPTASTDP